MILGFTAIPSVILILLLTFFFNFETPQICLKKGKRREAIRILRQIYSSDDVSDPLASIERGVNEAIKAEEKGLSIKKTLLNPTYRYVVMVGCIISAFHQFTGINVYVAASNKVFESAGLEGRDVTMMSTILMFIHFVATLPSLYLIDKWGRRTLLLYGLVGMTLSVTPAAVASWVDRTSIVTTWLTVGG